MDRTRSDWSLEAVNGAPEESLSPETRPVIRRPLFDTLAIATTDPLITVAAERTSEWKHHPENTLCVNTLQVAPYRVDLRDTAWRDHAGMSRDPRLHASASALITRSDAPQAGRMLGGARVGPPRGHSIPCDRVIFWSLRPRWPRWPVSCAALQ